MRAVVLRKYGKTISRSLERIDLAVADTPSIVCSLAYSSLNYKDVLAITKKGRVVRRWSMPDW